MLATLGYNPDASTPDYGKPDAFVQNNTNSIYSNPEVWEERAKNLFSQKNDANLSVAETSES